MDYVRLTNLTKGVLVLTDLNNANHINLLSGSHKDFTPLEYRYYAKTADVRVRNGLLKKEIIGDVIDKVKAEVKKVEEPVIAEVSEFLAPSELPEVVDLAGIDDEPVAPVVQKKKKKKNRV